jgi:hypothetical protein
MMFQLQILRDIWWNRKNEENQENGQFTIAGSPVESATDCFLITSFEINAEPTCSML